MDSAMSMSALVTALLDLQHQLRDLPRPLLIGGGFGLYLRQRHLEDVDPERTLVPSELWPPARTTEDVDLFLPTEIVVSTDHMRSIRKALDHLGYESTVRHFQFVKHTPVGPVRIDLLTCDIPTELTNLVRMRSMRVRPTGDVPLHAYLTREALELERSPRRFLLRGTRSDGTADEVRIHVPNSFTYLLMKLHAFRDRMNDSRKSLAAHHALDLYRIVAMMTRDEYDLVLELLRRHADSPAVLSATRIVSEQFNDRRAMGMIRLETGARDAGMPRSNIRGNEFRDILREFFTQGTPDGTA